MNRGDDQDDWFADLEPEERRAPDRDELEDAEDWLQDVRQPTRPWFETLDRRVLVLGAIAIALLIAVLAAAGVFSSSPKTAAPPAPSTPTTTAQGTTTSPAQPLPAPTAALKPGDTGAQVKVLQRALASLGFSTGKIDGQYGPATTAAVKLFQLSAKLTADGILGPATRTALATALRGP